MHSLRDILALLDRAERRRFRWLLLLIGAMGATTLTGVCSVIPLAALLADPRALERHPWAAPLLRAAGLTDRHGLLFIAAAACLLLVLLANLVNWLGAIALGRYAHRLGTRFGVALFAGYLARNVSFHRATSSALLLSNVIWEVPRGVTQLLQAWFTLLSQAVAAGLIVISVLLIQPAAALAAGTLLAVCYALFYLAGRARLQRNGHVESWAVAARTDVASQAFGGIREVTVLGAQPAFIRRFAAASEAMAGAACDTQALALVPRHLLEAALGISLVGAGLWLARDGRDTGAWLVPMSFLGIAAYRLLPALQQIFHSAVRIRSDRVAFARIAGDLRRALRPLPACAAAPATAAAPAGLRTLELRGVSFRYGTERAWILHALDLQITAGQMLGVIGTSGSGKSTLAELLLGLLKPAHGQVLVDGVPLADLELAAWHARVAYVPQEVFLFDSSIAYNVSLAEPGDLDPVRLAAALRDAQLSAWIESLPRGTDEPVGERGVRLSGGQRQRLGIARALYRRPALLLLDEITSALDPANEAGIVGMLAALKGRCTLVLIAHRRSALRHCDRLLDLDALREARAVELAPP